MKKRTDIAPTAIALILALAFFLNAFATTGIICAINVALGVTMIFGAIAMLADKEDEL